MRYMNCKKCNRYYILKKDESLNEFESCECGGDLEYVKNFNFEHNSKENIKNKKDLKMKKKSFNYKGILILSTVSVIIAILTVSYFYQLVTLIIDYSIQLSILLIASLSIRFIFNEFNSNNKIIKFIQKKSIFLIIPLFIIFISILAYKSLFFRF